MLPETRVGSLLAGHLHVRLASLLPGQTVTVSTLGLSVLYMYVFREYCLQLIMYSVSAQGVVERIIHYVIIIIMIE